MAKKIIDVTSDQVDRALTTVLENSYWAGSIKFPAVFVRRQDDTNGETGAEHEITVAIDNDGQVKMVLDGQSSLIFSPGSRTYNAIVLLCEAMRRDQVEYRQQQLSVAEKGADSDFMAALPKSVFKAVNQLLEAAYWIPELSIHDVYTRVSEDAREARDLTKELSITFSADADVWVLLPLSMYSLRFRSYFGGGHSMATRNALIVLAEAIRRDNHADALYARSA